MKNVFVIGAGTMGSGIAQTAAMAGCRVKMYDLKQEFVDRGLKNIRSSWDKLTAKGILDKASVDAALERISLSLDPDDAAVSDMIIEAAVE